MNASHAESSFLSLPQCASNIALDCKRSLHPSPQDGRDRRTAMKEKMLTVRELGLRVMMGLGSRLALRIQTLSNGTCIGASELSSGQAREKFGRLGHRT